MEKWEREWIRDLARKKLEMANTPEQKELARLFEPWFQVDTVISDECMYQVSGIRR